MKKRILTLAIITVALFTTAINLQAQVTMGSAQPPVTGALLDLKMDGTTTKGLALPRVTLTDKDKLYPMLSSGYNAAEDALHTGLVVYHGDKCTMSGKGVYVWTGSVWNKVGDDTPAGLNFNQDYFDLPSGHDARPLAAQNLKITWKGGIVPTWIGAASGGLSAIDFTGTPLAPTTLTASPTDMTLLPDAMTINPASPWASKQTDLTFTYTECGQTKTVTLNQTNYALKTSLTNNQIVYTTSTSGTFDVYSNATWGTTVVGTIGAGTVTPTSGGMTIKNGGNDGGTTINYSTSAGSKYDYTNITFADTETPKRFKDVTVSILNCINTQKDPTIIQWAAVIGFTTSEITAVTQSLPSSIKKGYQLHRDQNNNLFISGDFGADSKSSDGRNRWMLHNVRATNFDTNRTDGTTVISPNSITMSYQGLYPDPHMGYPGGTGITITGANDASKYNKSERLGRIYNWAAATMKKGGAAGTDSFIEGETSADENHNKVQGICPAGWHLPSDKEWTELEEEINNNTSKYSSLGDANGTITPGNTGWRGNAIDGHGAAMADACVTPDITAETGGRSNIYSSSHYGGFNAMFAGIASGIASNYGYGATFWSASGETASSGWVRRVDFNHAQVERAKLSRMILASVRCKKD
ncbi:FISUMP domain-containing protein [Dysgonomonas sp. 25]|uniref:FISUMP domain-containing protein n=1 Tax=Dysgonomonas sp. 25 TaxID=2302933 RepID=UPI0013D1323D|nr:FISUMP domain-containing protein [Dysgonomonas sp. 25]NDV69048.1 hypothetical protein [Dysgonomonas sp. 25]